MLLNHKILAEGYVCDLGSVQGLTKLMLARDYGLTVYATDLWSAPQENRKFFDEMGNATALTFEKEFFDEVGQYRFL